jgi:RimJ/RimL family protein N-acetyltransferase
MVAIIQSKNLNLLGGTKSILEAALNGEEDLSKVLGVLISENWTEFGTEPLQWALNMFLSDENEQNWLSYFPIHKKDHKLIGFGGYKGKPSDVGVVEIGYEITPAYRNRGFAKEFAKALIDYAFQNNEVQSVIAHTLAFENPSTSVLKKCGFVKVEEIEDPEDGQIWKWELKKKY